MREVGKSCLGVTFGATNKMGKYLLALTIVIFSLCFGEKKTSAQELDIKSSTSLKGECNAELNSVSLGCDVFLNSSFNNGRILYTFVTREIAGIGFAGNKLVSAGEKDTVLWIDRVYVNQTPTAADGQCGIEYSKGNRNQTKVECRAILRDGRKLYGTMISTEPNKIVVADNANVECKKTMKLHGFLSRAQFQCGFRSYNNELIAGAAACRKKLKLNESGFAELIRPGMELFDSNEKERGHKQVCNDVLKSFPNYVRR